MSIIRYLTAAIGAMAIMLMAGASGAQASGCPADQSVVDYKSNNPPYQCAVHYWSSKEKLSPLEIWSWSSDTAAGYKHAVHCRYLSDDGIIWSWDTVGPSYFAMFSNPYTSTRHAATGVIFTTGNYNSDQIKTKKHSKCETGDGKITNSIKRITQKITIDEVQGNGGSSGNTVYFKGTVSPSSSTSGYVALTLGKEPITDNGQPVVGPIKDGKYTIAWKTPPMPSEVTLPLSVVYPGDTSQCPAAAKTCGSTPAGPTDPVMVTLKKANVPLSGGETFSSTGIETGAPFVAPVVPAELGASASASASSSSGLVVRERSARMPARLGAKCPSGSVLIHAESNAARPSVALSYGGRGVQLREGAVAKGRKAQIQLICRKNAGAPLNLTRFRLGTARADRLATRKRGGAVFGGPRADRLIVANPAGMAQGGLGDDRLTVRAKNGTASGGPGDDVIVSRAGGRTLLIGGPGRDRVDASGKAVVNVRDGQRDRVVCRGNGVRVMADRHDVLRGDCNPV